MSKKIVAMLMAVAMAFSLLPVTALAGNTFLLSITPPNEGTFATYEFYKIDDTSNPWYTQTVKKGETLNRPADPTRTGYYFTGWKTEDGQEVVFGEVTVTATSPIKCYAQWKKNANPIHVYFMAAEKSQEGSQEVVYTGVAQNGAVAIPEDYKDITWKTADGKTFDGKNVTGDMNVYPASASCWLTFDSQGGSAIASHYVRQWESFELSKVDKPTKAGYTFAGWSLTTDGETVGQVIPKGDTKLYALWTPATADYTVIHWQENANDDGYSFKESQKLSGKTDGQTNAAAKSYEGFTGQAIKQQTIKGDGSTIVNVFYKRNIYKISFWYYQQSGWFEREWKEYTDIQITAKHGANISKQWPEIKGSKTWSTTKKLSDGPFQANIQTMPLGGAKYYGPKTGKTFESAQYYVEVLPGESGTVTQGDVIYKLDHTDTTPGSRLKVTEEDKYPLTGFKYKEGTDNGANYNNAKFYYTRNSYDVVYVNGAEVKKEPYKYEQDISGAGSYTPTAPAGYEFGGWYSDPIGTKKYDFSGKKMPAQNITVYAKWVPITLTLTIEDVEGVTSGTVNYNQVINEAEVYGQATTILENAGKTVLYWVTSTGERVDVNSQMTTNLTIRPVLKGDTYAVTYTSGANDSQKYWFNTIAKVKNYTGADDGKFLYWTDADENQYHPGDVIQMTANVTLTPNFSGENPVQQKYSVTYHSNFGEEQTYTDDSIENYTTFFTKTYTETRLPSQNGYKFTGWNTQSDGNGTSFAAGSPALMDGPDNNHLYAQWQRCTYTLTYDANGGYFGSVENTTTTEGMITAGKHDLLYTPAYTPNHEQTSEGKDVIFLGWSETDDSEKIYDKGDTIPNLIQSVTINGNKTVHAVWGYDAIGKDNKPDGVPDVFNAVVTYNIVGGTWDGTNNSATEVIKVKTFDKTTKIWTNTDAKLSSIPNINKVKPDENHTLSGSWGDPDSTPTENTVVTADKMYTYTLSPVTTGTLTITKKVVGDELTVDSLPENFQITVKDAQGETKGTLIKTEEAKKADGTLTWTISDLPAGEYTVSESNADVKDYTYTAKYNDVAATQANSATVDVTAGSESTMTVTNTYTKNQGPVTPTEKWDVSKSKTATKLDSNYESKVKLSIPSSEEQLVSDVVFVLDKSTSANLESQALAMLSNLKNQIKKTGAKVNVGVVIFNKVANIANDGKFFDLATEYNSIENAIKPEIKSGTNTHAGLLAGKDMLDADKTVDSNRKYLVFVSDGITYMYNKEPTVTAWTFWGDAWNTWAGPDNWASKYGSTEAPSDWNVWIQNIALKVTEQGTSYEYPYEGTVSQATPQENWNTAYANSTDKALYLTYQVYQDIVKAGYHCYAMTAESTSAQTYPWGTSFMSYLSDGTEVTFDSIQNDILYTVSAGSRVEDYMGYVEGDYNFDFINDASKLSITVGTGENKETLKAAVIGENHYGFGPVKKVQEPEAVQEMTTSETSYRYELEYVPGEKKNDEHFIWRINVPVSNFAPVALTYSVKLMNPKSASGTYGQYDENGSKNYSGLYTNNSATLYPVDSNSKPGVPENFLKPTVSYTVKGSSGSHSGGSRPSLNTKDHYGYIIGYPVDYYTGQPTTDQTKKPVRPEGKITRAEVATIYFRMLTDESRTKFWSQSSGYSDVKTGDWFNNAVSTLSKAGIIAGYEDGSFRPNGYITRAEFATIAARFFDVTYSGKDLFPDISGHWAKDYINQAANKGFVNGYEDGTFKPDRNITRAEAVTLVNRTLDRHPDKNHFTKDMLVWPDNMDQTKWYYADMQEATNSHTYQMKENSDKTKYENWTKTLPIRNWEALEKAWSNANSSQGNGNVV